MRPIGVSKHRVSDGHHNFRSRKTPAVLLRDLKQGFRLSLDRTPVAQDRGQPNQLIPQPQALVPFCPELFDPAPCLFENGFGRVESACVVIEIGEVEAREETPLSSSADPFKPSDIISNTRLLFRRKTKMRTYSSKASFPTAPAAVAAAVPRRRVGRRRYTTLLSPRDCALAWRDAQGMIERRMRFRESPGAPIAAGEIHPDVVVARIENGACRISSMLSSSLPCRRFTAPGA